MRRERILRELGKPLCPCIWLFLRSIALLDGTYGTRYGSSVLESMPLKLNGDDGILRGKEYDEHIQQLSAAASWFSAPQRAIDVNWVPKKSVDEALRMARAWRRDRVKRYASGSPVQRPPGVDARLGEPNGTFLRRVLDHLRASGIPLIPDGAERYVPGLYQIPRRELQFKVWRWDPHSKVKPPPGLDLVKLHVDNTDPTVAAACATPLVVKLHIKNCDNRDAPSVHMYDTEALALKHVATERAAFAIEVLLCWFSLRYDRDKKPRHTRMDVFANYLRERKAKDEQQAASVQRVAAEAKSLAQPVLT